MDLDIVLTVTTLVASLVLLAHRTDRMLPALAVLVAAVQTLMAFGLLTFAVARFRNDVILPALLVVAGGLCWGKSATKAAITAATLVTAIGAFELSLALHLVG